MGNLVLSRKTGESIMIGDDVKITVVALKDKSVRLSIEAPHETKIYRMELFEEISDQNKDALNWNLSDIDALLK